MTDVEDLLNFVWNIFRILTQNLNYIPYQNCMIDIFCTISLDFFLQKMEYFQIPTKIFSRPSFQLFSAVKAERVKITALCCVDIFSWNVLTSSSRSSRLMQIVKKTQNKSESVNCPLWTGQSCPAWLPVLIVISSPSQIITGPATSHKSFTPIV